MMTRRGFLSLAAAGALMMSANQLLAPPMLARAATITSKVAKSSFTVESPNFGRVNALNVGHGEFTGTRALFNEGLQWWQSDKHWHYMAARDPKKLGGDGYWVSLPGSYFTFRDNTPYQISFDLDFEQEVLRSFQIAEGNSTVLAVNLSQIPMYAWNWTDPASIEPQIQLYAGDVGNAAELLVTHVVLKNSDGSVFHEDNFDRIRWEFGMSMKGGSVTALQGAMLLTAPAGGGIDVFKRIGAINW